MPGGERKEYTMQFTLNAQMGGSYRSTFQSAQSQLLSMQKEIQALSRLQGDISAYQKQQAAVEGTRQKLAVLQEQYDNIEREMQETGTSSSDLKNKLLSKQQQIEKTTAALGTQTQKLTELENELKSAEVDTGNLTQESRRLSAEMRALKEGQEAAAAVAEDFKEAQEAAAAVAEDFKEAQEAAAASTEDFGEAQEAAAASAGTFGEKAERAVEAVSQALISAGIASMVREIADAYMECVGVSGEFEEAMSNVEALSGAGAEDMALLADKARELGATTKFTARESADAMGYMAMAGWDAEEMLAGMDSVMRLAAASGEDLATVSDIVTDNLTAFGLRAADTGRFADVLAAAATNSNTSVSVMGETFKNSASVAGALGYSIEDVAIATGLMANAGVKGSRAGTALRNVFNGLLDGVTLTSEAFGEYEYSAVKADGTMKSFSETIADLRERFDMMSEAERVNNARVLAGERGYNGLLAILNATSEDYGDLARSINESAGAAERMAAIKLDNTVGELTIMKSAWEGLKMTVGDEFNPVMRDIYGLLTGIINRGTDFVKEHPKTVKALAIIASGVGAVTTAVTAYTAVAKVAKALELGKVLAATGPWLQGAAAVGALTFGVVELVDAATAGNRELKEMTEAARSFADETEAAKKTYWDTVESVDATSQTVDGYIAKLEELNAVGELSEAQSVEYQDTLELLKQTMPELADTIELTADNRVADTKALRDHAEALMEDAKSAAYVDYLNTYMEKYTAVVKEATEAQVKLTRATNQYDTASKRYDVVIARMYELEDAQKAGVVLTQEELNEYHDLTDEMYELNNTMGQAEEDMILYREAVEETTSAMDGARDEYEAAKEAIDELTGAEEDLAGAEEDAGESAEDLADIQRGLIDAIGGVYDKVAELSEAYTDAYNAAYESVSGQYEIWDDAGKRIPTSISDINKALEGQVTYWQRYNDDLQTLTERAGDIEGLSELIASFADGSQESVNAVAGMADASDEDLRRMVESWQELKEEQGTVSDSIAEITTGYQTAIEEFQAALESEIGDMELSAEARANAVATIQGYIDGADEMLPQVQQAYNRVARAAERGMYGYSGGSGSPISYTDGGYASGTDNAVRGVRLVGERGPELEVFRGGERVINAKDTASLLSGGGGNVYEVSLSPSYVIDGAADPEEIERLLREHDDELLDRVLDMLREREEDAVRRSYI